MSQVKGLIKTLKRAFKAHGLTYADVASALKLSEPTVKRMLSSRMNGMTLARLEALCALVGLDVAALVLEAERGRARISHLTPDQEEEVVADLRLLLVAILVRNGWRYAEILETYELSEFDCIRLLARLDRLGLIELQPGNRIKLHVAPDFRWLPGGPIERFFEQRVQSEFLAGGFDEPGALRLYLSAPLARASVDSLHRRLQHLAVEFAQMQATDAALPLAQRRNTGLLLALRPWELGAFRAMKRRGPANASPSA